MPDGGLRSVRHSEMKEGRMKRGIFGICIAALVLGYWLDAAWPASPMKIGFIDLQRIIESSEKGKEFRERLFQFRKERERTLAARQEELNRMRQDYQQKSFTLSDRARLDKEQELRQKELEFKNLSESYRQEVLMEGRKLQTLMFRELSDLVRELGQKEGFTVILDKDVLLYASDSIDITDKVIQLYDAQAKKSKR
jgi:outer membrane protein